MSDHKMTNIQQMEEVLLSTVFPNLSRAGLRNRKHSIYVLYRFRKMGSACITVFILRIWKDVFFRSPDYVSSDASWFRMSEGTGTCHIESCSVRSQPFSRLMSCAWNAINIATSFPRKARSLRNWSPPDLCRWWDSPPDLPDASAAQHYPGLKMLTRHVYVFAGMWQPLILPCINPRFKQGACVPGRPMTLCEACIRRGSISCLHTMTWNDKMPTVEATRPYPEWHNERLKASLGSCYEIPRK